MKIFIDNSSQGWGATTPHQKEDKMKVRKVTKYLIEDYNLPLSYEPIEDTIKVKQDGGYTKVGYLIQDNDTSFLVDNLKKDKNLFLVAYNRNFWIEGKEHGVNKELSRLLYSPQPDKSSEGYEEWKEWHSKYWIFPLEAYIHSGVRLALSYEGNFPDRRWDVSQLGLVFASKKEWKKMEEAKEQARNLVKLYNQIENGEVYCVVVETFDSNNECVDTDIIGGFIGGDYARQELDAIFAEDITTQEFNTKVG